MFEDFPVEIVQLWRWHEPPFSEPLLAEYANPGAQCDQNW
jgi:hypothetical protein